MDHYAIKWARELERMEKASATRYAYKALGVKSGPWDLALGAVLMSVIVALGVLMMLTGVTG